MKMVLAMRHGVLPRTLHAEQPTDRVDWTTGAVSLLAEATPWPETGAPRRAGVSAFGISGTNAHVIVEQAPAADVRTPTPADPGDGSATPQPATLPCVVSARTPEALRDQARLLRSHVDGQADIASADVAYSLATTRAALSHRAAVLAGDRDELLRGLDALTDGASAPNVLRGVAREGQVGFLFTGQGAQRARMGQQLAEAFPAFAGGFDEICDELDSHLDRPLREILFAADGSPEAELLHQTVFAQSGLFAVEVALARLLDSWGVQPDYLLGHSIGELAAAHVAGVLSVADACALVAARGRLMQALPPGGAMVAVRATEAELLPLLAGREGEVSLAAVNGPDSVVVSGAADAVLDIAAYWQAQGRKVRKLRVSHAFHSPAMEPMLADFHAVAAGMSYTAPRVPIVSNLTGTVVSAAEICSPDYWVRQVRGTVRFADGVRTLLTKGTTTFLELGPDGVLTALGQDCAAQFPGVAAEHIEPSFTATLRADRSEAQAVTAAVAHAHTRGAAVDWAAFFADRPVRPVDLPTYAFQPTRYWLTTPAETRNAAAVGLADVRHPLLGVAVELPDTDGFVFSGRLCARDHAWLVEHGVLGTPLVPGTAYVDMAAVAAERLGCSEIVELTLHAPLALPARGGVLLRLTVGAVDDAGRRPLSLHSRPEDAASETPWVRHASGFLQDGGADAAVAPELAEAAAWPPPGAVPVDVDDLYHRLAEHGFDYGPLFRGLRAAWRAGDDVLAEVHLAQPAATDAGRFFLHPALLDAGMHGIALVGGGQRLPEGLPFAFGDVRLGARGASALRVRLTRAGTGFSLQAADLTGRPVLSVGSVVLRRMPAGQAATAGAPLYTVQWQRLPAAVPAGGSPRWAVLGDVPEPLSATLVRQGLAVTVHPDVSSLLDGLAAGDRAPDVVLTAPVAAEGTPPAVRARDLTCRVAESLRTLLSAEVLQSTRLVVATSGAVAVREDAELTDLAAAPLWGLLRSAQAEHPGRCVLVDLDGHDPSWQSLAVATSSGEPQAAVRSGVVYVPRLAHLRPLPVTDRPPMNPEGTVLITGGTTGLGALLACHLVTRYGVRRLLLVSRAGAQSPGAPALLARLAELGAQAEVAACDIADRGSVAGLLAAIPADHPLTAVVHAAGVVADGVIESLTRERIERVMLPKVDGALHLHDLTSGMDLSAFVLFSSLSGTLGGAGQGNYAAANAFLDALAHRRRAAGLPAVSLAWGPWAHEGMANRLGDNDLRRLRAAGLLSLTAEQGLAAFDAALTADHTVVAPARLDLAAIRGHSTPPLLHDLAPAPRPEASPHRTDTPEALRERLATLTEPDQHHLLLDLLRAHTAGVLGHAGAENVDPTLGFLESGFDSLTAVELRNHLNAATGLRLPTTLLFDYPTPVRLAEHLRTELLRGDDTAAPAPVLDELSRLEAALATVSSDEATRTAVVTRLRDVLAKWSESDEPQETADLADHLRTATAQEVFDFIDSQI